MPKTGDWKKLNEVLNRMANEKRLDRYLREATEANAADAQREIVLGIQSQRWSDWPPLADKTIKRKLRQGRHKSAGGIKILIDTGQLINNITYKVYNAFSAAVGVMKGTFTKEGESLTNIAAVHEFGSRDGRIPARPYLYRGARLAMPRMIKRWAEAVKKTWR